MTSRERKLGVLLLLLGAICAIVYVVYPPSFKGLARASVPKSHIVDAALAAEFAKIRAAEAIEDPEQQCLAVPDPPDFSWDPKVVQAMCHLKRRQMISWAAINEALDRHDIALLQATFDGYLEQTFTQGHHGFLVWTFDYMFQNPSKEELETTTRWVEADPASAYALAARGTHYVAAASAARGTALSGETPGENFVRMGEFAEKGKADLDESLRRNPRLIASYRGLLHIAQLLGDEELRESAATKALEIDPFDQWIYDGWFDAAEPKWGGSVEEMRHVADLAGSRADINPLLSRTRGRPFCYAAEEATCTKCNRPSDDSGALTLYRKAAAYGPVPCFLEGAPATALRLDDPQTAALYYTQTARFLGGDAKVWRAEALYRLGQFEWALADLDQLLKTYPDYLSALREKSYILEMDGNATDAEPPLRKMLDIDAHNEYAALQLSRLYLSKLQQPAKAAPLVAGLLERNPTLARAWLYKAALAQGDEAACLDALRKYLQYVDRNDAYEQRDLSAVEARVKELEEKGQRAALATGSPAA